MSERWNPEQGETYYFVNSTCDVSDWEWLDDSVDRLHYKNGNCFSSEEKAKAAAEKVKALLLSLHCDESLQDKQLPKLTTEVFDRPDCPEWAQYAAVDINGTAHYYDERPYPLGTSFYNNRAHSWSVGGYFDPSDWKNSLIERPNKLPEWCKVDAVGWHKRCGYFKVTRIDDVSKRVDIQQVEDRYKGYLSFHTVCNEAVQASLRPYNEGEMRSLVGKVIESEEYAFVINSYSDVSKTVRFNGYNYTSADLLNNNLTINGKPCFVLEHL